VIVCGVSALNHDASFAIVDTETQEILFASHAERYSRKKNDARLDAESVKLIRSYSPSLISWYERPLIKKARQLYAGQLSDSFALGDLPAVYLRRVGLGDIPVVYHDHHLSHAAAGYYTSQFDDACVVVIDAVGEWDTLSIWRAKSNELTKVFGLEYPSSLGLFYSAFTQRVGLKPNEEEYILMGMAGYGEPVHYGSILNDFIDVQDGLPVVKRNCHLGVGDYLAGAELFDIAASVQAVISTAIELVLRKAQKLTGSRKLVYMGGVALNCAANKHAYQLFDDVWIMPNPGDAGSSIGAAALVTKQKLKWRGPYLGHSITGDYPVEAALAELLGSGVCGVASGKAEFGPRALGNRSLLADPRGAKTKDNVNLIKKREKYRPFAPAILSDLAADYFEMPPSGKELPYMQLTVACKRPEEFPAVVHIDGTSRVQTVSAVNNPGFHALLKAFHEKTGCPMLLNTSLNIKGEPLVNNRSDVERFSRLHGIRCH
jgi:carbamoyltransferase